MGYVRSNRPRKYTTEDRDYTKPMKPFYAMSSTLLLILILSAPTSFQPARASTQMPAAQTPAASPTADSDVDGIDVEVAAPLPDDPELTNEQRQVIHQQINQSVRRLQRQGRLAVTSQAQTLLSWPLVPVAGDSLTDFSYYVIANYVDHDPGYPGQLRDYRCDVLTYDTAGGYNHQGTDILLSPLQWNKMANGEVAVVAAAPGTVVYKQDGQYDRSCGFGGQPWNAVYVQHSDGSIAWYGHLRNGSVTTKQIGDRVTTGEYLGMVGSSGNSTTPHLHLEVYDPQGNLIDPFQGACNTFNATSWWRQQPPYKDSGVNKLTTGDAPPEYAACPGLAVSHARERFDAGERVYFTAYVRHFGNGQHADYTITQPDGSLLQQWRYTRTNPHLIAGWIYRSYTLPADAPSGEWTFEVQFAGKVYRHVFQVGNVPPTATATPTPQPSPAASPTSTPTTATPTPLPPTPDMPTATPTPSIFATVPPAMPPHTPTPASRNGSTLYMPFVIQP